MDDGGHEFDAALSCPGACSAPEAARFDLVSFIAPASAKADTYAYRESNEKAPRSDCIFASAAT